MSKEIEPEEIFCGYCGKKNHPSYNFCTDCGKSLKKSEDNKNINNISDIDFGEGKENADNLESQGEVNGQPRLSQFFKLSWLPFFLSFVLVFLNFLGSGRLGNSHEKLEGAVGPALLGITFGLTYGFFSYWRIGASYYNCLVWAFFGSIYLAVVFGAAGFSIGCAFWGGGHWSIFWCRIRCVVGHNC
jgi:hypothetical protein